MTRQDSIVAVDADFPLFRIGSLLLPPPAATAAPQLKHTVCSGFTALPQFPQNALPVAGGQPQLRQIAAS